MLGEWILPRVQETFSEETTLFEMDVDPVPENCKNQAINRIKSKKINRTIKLCTLANII